MLFSSEINQLRQYYVDAWQKFQNNLSLSDLELQIVGIVKQHPEYHLYLQSEYVDVSFYPKENPFLHLSLHLALQEQLQTNRPYGIREIFDRLKHQKKYRSSHEVEHELMTILMNFLQEAQYKKQTPDEQAYLLACQHLVVC